MHFKNVYIYNVQKIYISGLFRQNKHASDFELVRQLLCHKPPTHFKRVRLHSLARVAHVDVCLGRSRLNEGQSL